MSNSSSPTPMLLLAAIDMLTAALVCGVILFVVLVGGQAESITSDEGQSDSSAPSVVEVETHSGPDSPPTIPGAEVVSTAPLATPDELGGQFLTPPLRVTTYILKAGVHEISLEGVSSPTEVIVHDGTGPVTRVGLRCGASTPTISIGILPHPSILGTCPPQPQQTQALTFANAVKVAVLREDANRTQIPTDWRRIDFSDLANGSRQMLLESTAASAALPADIRMIAEY